MPECQLGALGNRHRHDGNAHFHRGEYRRAIHCYNMAIKCYPSERLHRHPGYSSSLANRASAYMSIGQFHSAANDLEEAIGAIEPDGFVTITQDTRATLIKYVLRLVRCYLALLDGPHATSKLEIIQRLDDSGVHSPPPNGPQRSEYTRTKFLTGLEKRINSARSNELWQEALDIIQLLEQEIVGWGFQFNLACLPGLWTCWKAESLARLGKPVEADEVLAHLIACPSMEIEFKLTKAWVAVARADLRGAQDMLSEVWTRVPSDTPSACRLSSFLKPLESALSKLKSTCSQSGCHSALEQARELLTRLNEPILTTIRIRVEVMRCEILTMLCLRDPSDSGRFQLCHQIIKHNRLLHKRLNFTDSKSVVYEPHRVYLVRSLLAQAYSMKKCLHDDWRSTFITISDLIRLWPDLDIPGKQTLLKCGTLLHLCPDINLSQSSSSPFNNSHPHSSQTPSSGTANNFNQPTADLSDPKGYYRTLGLQRSASMSEIKSAFRKLSLIHHPDKGGRTNLFQAISLAHSVLSDPESKLKYDRTGR
ncbi:hypothetical protein PtB15_15B404 [Puccinia triticina]|nr:hypothetical protein PtB15_15B404 [Puccinia triticina]